MPYRLLVPAVELSNYSDASQANWFAEELWFQIGHQERITRLFFKMEQDLVKATGSSF
jgi:hypothetical protein